MAEEQIDKLTIEVESVGGDDKSIADIRKQLEKLGRVDLSGTIKQLGNLRAALGYLGTVDDSVKSMLDNMTKLGLRASSAREVTNTFKAVSSAAVKAEENIRNVQEAYSKWVGGKPSITVSQDIKEDTTGSYNFGLGRDMSDEEAREIRANAAAKRAAKMAAAGEWFDSHANTKSYNEEMLKGTKDQLKELEDRIFGVGNEAKKAGNKATKALEQTNTAAKKTQKTTSKLGDAFVRIVRFKIGATVLQNVIQTAKEGTTALGEFDAEFKETLNTYSAASKAVGGSFALSLAPALEAAAPLIEYIADGIGSIGNSISMITAMIKGDDFYQAVKPVSKIREEMAAAEEKAKNVKQLISGFDELNIFQKPDTDETGIKIFEDQELSWGNDELREDLANLAEFISVAGAAALAVGFLKNAFSGKNKTLKEQTDLTKDDVKETQTMKETVSALIPQVNGVTSALGILGGMGLPALDSSGITVPAGEAVGAANDLGDALDVVGAKQPAPVLATDKLYEGLGAAGAKINEFVTAEYAPVVLSGSDAELVKAMEAAGVKVSEFASGLTGEFNTQFGEIKNGWSLTLGDMQDMADESTEKIGVTYKTAFGEIETEWATTMGAMLDLALTAFDNVELMWDSTISDMQAAWSKAFAGGLTVNTPQVEEKPNVNPNASPYGGTLAYSWTNGLSTSPVGSITPPWSSKKEQESEFDKSVAQGKIKSAFKTVFGAIGDAIEDFSGLPRLGFSSIFGGAYANGGLVTAGQFFMARENGKPEYIGSFGNQTGVANNEQIVSGISGGVEAVLAAYIPQIIRAIEENATAVNIGDDQIARAASRGAARYQRVTGRSLFS